MTNTPTPSPEEVARAFDWLATHAENCTDLDCACTPVFEDDGHRLPELLASYLTERFARLPDDVADTLDRANIAEDARRAAESRLTSLREGLRRLVARIHTFMAASNFIRECWEASDELREAESLLAGLSEEGK